MELIRMDPNLFPDWRTNATRAEIYGNEGLMYLGRHGGVFPDPDHQKNFIESLRARKQPNGTALQGQLSATLVHMGYIACRVGNKHLIFDGATERFIGNEEANMLIKTTYRENYKMPEKV